MPIAIGVRGGAYAAVSETTSFPNLGCEVERELGPGEIALASAEGVEQFRPAGGRMRIRRPFVKWARSFMPRDQSIRDVVARMKLIPVLELGRGARILFCGDSIVRGTQLRDTVRLLFEAGVEAVHIRPGCPPPIHGCEFLDLSRSRSDFDLAGRAAIRELATRPEPSRNTHGRTVRSTARWSRSSGSGSARPRCDGRRWGTWWRRSESRRAASAPAAGARRSSLGPAPHFPAGLGHEPRSRPGGIDSRGMARYT